MKERRTTCYFYVDIFVRAISLKSWNVCIVSFRQVFGLRDIYYNIIVEKPELR